MTDTPEEERQTKPFAATLNELRSGKTAVELSKGLQDVVQAVMHTHKPGKVTLTITVSKSKFEAAVSIDDTVTVKLPPEQRNASLFYVDDESNLHRNDPRQLAIPGMAAVPNPTSERAAQ